MTGVGGCQPGAKNGASPQAAPPDVVSAGIPETSDEPVSFGPFVLRPAQRILLCEGKPVQLGSRALDILCLLVEHAGQVVSKDEILARVWPNTYVADGNLRVHVAGLRRSLGDGRNGQRFIVNVPSRGYSFVGEIQRGVDRETPRAATPASAGVHRFLPALQTRVIGRDQAIRTLEEQMLQRRLVTIVGTGGVGKTTLAISVVTRLLEGTAAARWSGAYFVDLASLSDGRLVASALASALGITELADDNLPSLLAYLRDKSHFLILDNCEHVIGAVAQLAEAVLRNAPGIHILATSREPLRVDGEGIHHLQPLAMPPTASSLSSSEAVTYPAVELFIERASARFETFTLREEDVEHVMEICRRLDGIPLALELAAGRIDALGVRGLATALDSLFSVLTKGRRTALPRHQTLYATLDWSFNLLGPRHRILLRRLSVFSGPFTLGSCTAVAAWGELSAGDVVEGLSDLVAQSLVTADVSRDETYFRLLETTRAYVRAKLIEDRESAEMGRRHAEHCHALIAEADTTWSDERAGAWRQKYSRLMDDVRSALSWAFSADGDALIGVNLTIAAVPVWFQLSLINECRERVEHALDALPANEMHSGDVAMKLHAARGWSLMYTAGAAREKGAAWSIAYELAEQQGDTDYCLRALWGLWAGKMNNAEFVAAREIAERFGALAPKSADPTDPAIGDRMLGTSLHFLGDQARARHHIERMVERYDPPSRRAHIVRYQFDPRITAQMTLTRVLWLHGLPDRAVRMVDASVDEARTIEHALTLCNTIAQSACPVALWAGDLERAERFSTVLLRETARHGLDIWHGYANCYRGQILLKRGDIDGGLSLVQGAVEKLKAARFIQYYTAFLVVLAEGSTAAGRTGEALSAIEEALEQSERTRAHWATPEMLRIKAEIVLRDRDAATAECLLVEALDLARRQMALSWQLRIACSMARMWHKQSRAAEAKELLAPIYGQFDEGFATTDLIAARELLAELG